jgi:hypothetical protein
MQGIEHILWALTPMQRWSAARQLQVKSASGHWFTLWAGAVLVLLVALLIWVSYRRWVQSREQKRETPADNMLRRGLSTRENQILLAIAVRSGVRRAQDILTSASMFSAGVEKLLAECVSTRTSLEREQLQADIAGLRKKLGFPAVPAESATGPRHPSSRNVPVGRRVELIRDGQEIGREVQVVRNDDIELALELPAATESRPGERWRVRYYYGMSIWEFETSAVHCENGRLILNHSDAARRANRRRFPRVPVHVPAQVAYLPFLKEESAAGEEGSPSAAAADTTGADTMAGDTPRFVEGLVTELAGPGLRIEAPLQVELDDRVLVVFALAGSGAGHGRAQPHTIAAAGRVRHCQAVDRGMSIAVELTGLNDAEVDVLVRATDKIASQAGAAKIDEAFTRVMAAT